MKETPTKPLIGISACLLGHQVRFDGGHKRDTFITGPLAKFVQFVPVCPEAAIGLGIPRPSIRLVGDPQKPIARGTKDPSRDVTTELENYSRGKMTDFANLSGFILKKDSPTCGMERVKVYSEQGGPAQRNGTGIFARILMEHYPLLPVEEEGRLNDPVLRENFINRIYVYRHWKALQQQGVTAANLISFHTQYKYLVMAHSQAAYKRLGKLLSDLSGDKPEQVSTTYIQELMSALTRRVNRKRHVNVLHHIMGYLKRHIDSSDKQELLNSIEAYREEEIPLIVPITLLRHYFRRHPDPYMQQQVYLQPHPAKLGLRSAL